MVPDELIVAIALILVLEGSLYALFPEGMRKMALQIERMPASLLRRAGLLAATIGVGIIWLVRN
ncbi:MAG: DUF2065 domain-containing protein [Pseudomonadota bacterium]|nr:DUF2065 domain-containing protein [Pseudomonadota bacterium]